MHEQTGSVGVFLLVAAVLVTVVVVGRHISKDSIKLPASSPVAAAQSKPTPSAPNECANNGSGKTLLVSIADQRMWACQGTDMIKQSAVTTGASSAPNGVNDSTPVGTWHIYEKFRNLHLKGSDRNGPWDDYVQYWMPFDTAVGFHDASWQTFPFGNNQYKTSGSHGCVQLPTSIAAWLYAWAPVGTSVTVQA